MQLASSDLNSMEMSDINSTQNNMMLEPENTSKLRNIVSILSGIVILLLVGVVGLLYFRSHRGGSNFVIDKFSQYQLTYDSLPSENVNTVVLMGSMKSNERPCANATVYKSVDDALKVKDQKVCVLAIDNNQGQFNKLVQNIDQLQDVEYLFIRHNSLTEIPDFLSKLPHLRGVDLSWNKIVSVKPMKKVTNRLQLIVMKDMDLSAEEKTAIRKNINSGISLTFE